jgi:hypothetical protein
MSTALLFEAVFLRRGRGEVPPCAFPSSIILYLVQLHIYYKELS